MYEESFIQKILENKKKKQNASLLEQLHKENIMKL